MMPPLLSAGAPHWGWQRPAAEIAALWQQVMMAVLLLLFACKRLCVHCVG
jgi:hypothetical protein